MRVPVVPLIVLGLVGATLACNALVGYGDFTKASPEAKADDDDDTSGTSTSSGQVGGGGIDGGDANSSSSSGDSGAVTVACDPTKDFGAPVRVPVLDDVGVFNGMATLTDDERTVIFQRSTTGNDGKVMRATRAAVTDNFGPPAAIDELAQTGKDYGPSLRGDGLVLLYGEPQVGDRQQLLIATRTLATGNFENVQPFAPTQGSHFDEQPYVSADAKEIYFTSDRIGGGLTRIYRVTATTGGGWTAPAEVTELGADTGSEIRVALSHDGLTIFFGSNRTGAGGIDIFVAHRTSTTAPFGTVTPLTSLNTAGNELATWLSPDNCRLYVTTIDGNSGHLLVATRKP